MRTGEPNIYWSVSDAKSFRKGRVIHSTLDGKQDHPSVTIDSKGVTWVAWEDSRDGITEIRVRSESADDEHVVSVGRNTSFPVIASGENIVAVAYESAEPEGAAIRFRRLQ